MSSHVLIVREEPGQYLRIPHHNLTNYFPEQWSWRIIVRKIHQLKIYLQSASTECSQTKDKQALNLSSTSYFSLRLISDNALSSITGVGFFLTSWLERNHFICKKSSGLVTVLDKTLLSSLFHYFVNDGIICLYNSSASIRVVFNAPIIILRTLFRALSRVSIFSGEIAIRTSLPYFIFSGKRQASHTSYMSY